MNAATSVAPIIPRATERHQPQVPLPPLVYPPVPPPQKPKPAAIPDDRERVQHLTNCNDEKGKGRSNIPPSDAQGNKAPSSLATVPNTFSQSSKRGVRDLGINPPVYRPVETADNKDDYRHHVSSSCTSDTEKQSHNGYGIPSENEYLTVSNQPHLMHIGSGPGPSENSSDVDKHLRRIIVPPSSPTIKP